MRYQIRLDKPRTWEPSTPAGEAATKFVLDVDAGRTPDPETLGAVRDALMAIMGSNGKAVGAVFGFDRGGRPKASGFTPGDIVSVFIELERRKLGGGDDALGAAKAKAGKEFAELAKPIEDDSRLRTINRHWKAGRKMAECLSDADLESIIAPHQIPDKNP